MNQKQLANVLIKIIGLYVCLCAIPQLFTLFVIPIVVALRPVKLDGFMSEEIASAVGAAVQAAVGIILIIKSRKLAEYWFKNEAE